MPTIRFPDTKGFIHTLRPDAPTLQTLPIYMTLKSGLTKFKNYDFVCEIPKEKDRNHTVLHMSSIGYCGRFQWMQLHAQEEYSEIAPFKPGPYLHLGHMIEAYTIQLLEVGGLRVTNAQITLRDLKDQIIGHIDGMVSVNNQMYLLEIKGLKHSSVEKLITQGVKRAIRIYYSQMQYYMFCLELSGAYFIALDKDSSEWYIEYVEFDAIYARGLRKNALNIITAPSFEEVPEATVVRNCRFCPLADKCAKLEGKDTFLSNFVQYEESLEEIEV